MTVPEIDQYLCAVIRGEQAAWPQASEEFVRSFLQQSSHHGVQALVFDCANKSGAWADWPEEVKDALTQTIRIDTAFDLLRGHKLSILTDQLSQLHIRILLIKGEALARTIFSHPGLRSRCDTDLFIDVKDVPAVHSALLEFGWEIIPPIYKSHQFMAESKAMSDATKAPAITLDIHWRILNASRFARVIEFSDAWDHAGPVPDMPGCRALGLVDALLLACMHRKGNDLHDENRLIWLYDLHLLVSRMTPDQLHEFATKAVDNDAQSACLDGLSKTKVCFTTVIPDDVMSLLMTPDSSQSIRYRLVRSNLALLINDFWTLPGFRAKLGLLKELLFPSAHDLLQKHGKFNKIWLPWFYMEHAIRGLWNRLLLR